MAHCHRVLLVLCCLPSLASAARVRSVGAGGQRGAAKLQPQLVADLLNKVEDKWKSEAASFVACSDNDKATGGCGSTAQEFRTSCSTVMDAVIQASSGDRAVVGEYLNEVCSQDVLQGWKKAHCGAVKQVLMDSMTEDNLNNRQNLDISKTCNSLWKAFSDEEAVLHKQEEEKNAKAQEEEAKRAAEQAEADKKRRAEEEKRAEEARKEEAKRQAEEAKRRAEEERQRREREKAEEEERARREVEQAAAKAKHEQEEAQRLAEQAKQKLQQAQATAQRFREKKRKVQAEAETSPSSNSSAAALQDNSSASALHLHAVETNQTLANSSTNDTADLS